MSTANTPSGIEWRYTAKKVRMGTFDAQAVVPPMLLFFMKIKMWTFAIFVLTVVVMWTL